MPAVDKARARKRQNEWQRVSHAADPEKRNAPQRRRYQNNEAARQRSLTASKAWMKANRERVNAYAREWNSRNPDKVRARNFKQKLRRYGLTQEQYDAFLLRQDHRCAICHSEFVESGRKRINVDHCHKTGRARGLLCVDCNFAIGQLGESPSALERAIEYIQTGGSRWD